MENLSKKQSLKEVVQKMNQSGPPPYREVVDVRLNSAEDLLWTGLGKGKILLRSWKLQKNYIDQASALCKLEFQF